LGAAILAAVAVDLAAGECGWWQVFGGFLAGANLMIGLLDDGG
jgi:hypothetical protein